MLFLFLVPTTMIIAQNATSNLTGDIIANLSHLNATPAGDPAAPAEPLMNQTTPENASNPAPVQLLDISNATSLPLNVTNSSDMNATDPSIPANATVSQAVPPSNETFNVTPILNTTLPEEVNITETAPLGPVLELTLDVPDRTDRNQPFQVSAMVTNVGDRGADKVEIEWILPKGLSITEGSGVRTCDIPAGGSCRSDVAVAASLSSMLGEQEIKAVARYLR